jgi:acetyl esterase/lipase
VPAGAILTDVLDCITYIRSTLLTAANLTPQQVNPTKLIVSGSSAGGYLALLSALHCTSPPPAAILAIYPITDPLGPFFTTPQPHADGHIARETVAEFLDPKAEAVSGNPPDSKRGKMYYWMLQTASLAELLSVTEADVEMRIARAITARGVGQGEKLPPVYVVHGDRDRAVGVEQADEVVEVIRDVGGTWI